MNLRIVALNSAVEFLTVRFNCAFLCTCVHVCIGMLMVVCTRVYRHPFKEVTMQMVPVTMQPNQSLPGGAVMLTPGSMFYPGNRCNRKHKCRSKKKHKKKEKSDSESEDEMEYYVMRRAAQRSHYYSKSSPVFKFAYMLVQTGFTVCLSHRTISITIYNIPNQLSVCKDYGVIAHDRPK